MFLCLICKGTTLMGFTFILHLKNKSLLLVHGSCLPSSLQIYSAYAPLLNSFSEETVTKFMHKEWNT